MFIYDVADRGIIMIKAPESGDLWYEEEEQWEAELAEKKQGRMKKIDDQRMTF